MTLDVATRSSTTVRPYRRCVLLLDPLSTDGQISVGLTHLSGSRGTGLDACLLVDLPGCGDSAAARARSAGLRRSLRAAGFRSDIREADLDELERLLSGRPGRGDEPTCDEVVVLQHSLLARLLLRRLLAATLNRSQAAPRPVPALSLI